MKTKEKVEVASALILIFLIGTVFFVKHIIIDSKTKENDSELLLSDNTIVKIKETSNNKTANKEKQIVELNNNDEENNITEEAIDENKDEEVIEDPIVFDGLTRQELIDKLNRNLKSTLDGTGELFANLALDLGIDPYLAVAIVLHETGCSWDCSQLVKTCNNVGGLKGNPGCGGGSYAAFETLDEGISRFMNNLYNNYYAYGLTTPEAINPKYAASTTWASSINNYMSKIKAS